MGESIWKKKKKASFSKYDKRHKYTDLRSWAHPKLMRCINADKATSHPRYIIVKVLKANDKEEKLENSQR